LWPDPSEVAHGGFPLAINRRHQRCGESHCERNVKDGHCRAAVFEKEFNAALDEFRLIVGDNVERVKLSTLIEGDYSNNPKTHDLYHMYEKEHFMASAVVKPASTEEVQAIVRVANKYKIPLWVTSMGRNLGYGGAARKTQIVLVLISSRLRSHSYRRQCPYESYIGGQREIRLCAC
jgi:hypothetical protein